MRFDSFLNVGIATVLLALVPSIRAEEKKTMVSIDEINSGQAQIVGKLGLPIGTAVRIDGEWIRGDRYRDDLKAPAELTFRVTNINGERAEDKLEFYESDVLIFPTSGISKEVGEPVAVYAFESCFFAGLPRSVVWPEGHRVPQIPRAFGLYSRLELIRALEPQEQQKSTTERKAVEQPGNTEK